VTNENGYLNCGLSELKLLYFLNFQATLERLEGMIQMPSQQEFEQMTSESNGHHLNGHGSAQGL